MLLGGVTGSNMRVVVQRLYMLLAVLVFLMLYAMCPRGLAME